MRFFRVTSGLMALVLILAQCSKNPKARIEKLQHEMSAPDFKFDEKGLQVADDLINAYVAYADTLKKDPDAPRFLFEAGNLAMNLNQNTRSMELFNRIIYQYPDFEKVPDCLFLLGYIYENNLQNYGKAKEIYEDFLRRYPDHDFADDARISLQNLGKPLEELVKEFESRNQVN